MTELRAQIEAIHPADPLVHGMQRHAREEFHRLAMATEADPDRRGRLEEHVRLMREAAGDAGVLAGRQFVVAFPPGPGVGRDWPCHYWVYLPPGYFAEEERRWPAIYFLHGSGERGDDPAMVPRHGPPREVSGTESHRWALVLSPQAPADHEWELPFLEALAADAESRLRIDPDRVVLTGLSRGGAGAWSWAIENPGRFAGVAPVCGWTNPIYAERLSTHSVWVVHSADDGLVAVHESDLAVARLRARGTEVRYRRPTDEGHGSWIRFYADEDFWQWALSRRRPPRETVPPHGRTAMGLSGTGRGDGLGPIREVGLVEVIPPGTAWSVPLEARNANPAPVILAGMRKLYGAREAVAGVPSTEVAWLVRESWYLDGHWRGVLALPACNALQAPGGISPIAIPREGRALAAWFHGTAEETENAWHRMEQRALLDGYKPRGLRLQAVHGVEREGVLMMRELVMGVEE